MNPNSVEEPFWMVFADQPEVRATYRHTNLGEAMDEAKRLAGLHRGVRFYLAKFVGYSFVVPDPAIWTDLIEIPF